MEELFNPLWRASWQGAIAVVVVYSLLRFFPKTPPALTCWLWRLVGLKFLMTLALSPLPSLTLPLLPATGAVIPAQIPETAPIAALVAANATPPQDAVIPAAPKSASLLAQAAQGGDWRLGLLIIYFAGVAVALTRAIRAAFVALRLIREAVPADSDAVRAVAAELAGRLSLRRVPRFAQTAKCDSPLLAFGTILLPESATPDALRLMLAHELAHVQRRDLVWEWLGTLTQILFWFHPLILWARREERLARESAADALALQTANAPAAEYGLLLLSLSISPRRSPLLVGAVGAAETGTALRRRLLALSAASDSRLSPFTRASVVALCLAALLSLIPLRLIRAEAQTPTAPTPMGTAQLSAVITESDGKPRANASVELKKWVRVGAGLTVQDAETTTTDAEGRFTFSDLEAGKYFVLVEPGEGQQGARLTFHIVLSEEQKRSLALKIPPLAQVRGCLTYKANKMPASGIRVLGWVPLTGKEAEDLNLTVQSRAETGDDGQYVLSLAAGEAQVAISPFGGSGFQGKQIQEQKARLTLQTGQTATQNLTVVAFASSPVNEIKPDAPPAPVGTAQLSAVITESDGKPRAKALVELIQVVKVAQGITTQVAGKTNTDAEGRFTFSDLKAGKYFVRVEAREGRTESGLSFNIALSASEKRNLALKIPPLAQVKGRLTYKGNKMPAAGCRLLGRVRLTREEADDLNLSIYSYTDTDKEGRYVLPLAAGKAEVTVTSSGGVGPNGKQVQVQEQKATLPLQTGQTGTQNFAVLPVASLQFKDARGMALAGVSVNIFPENLDYSIAGTCDDGVVFLETYSSGTFRAEKGALRASGTFKRDLDTGMLTFRTETQAGTAADGNAVILLSETPSASLTGKVADESGKPIRNARIKLTEVDPKTKVGRRDPDYKTDAEGRFSLPLALGGEYYLYIRADGYNQVAVINSPGFIPTRGETKDVGLITLRKAEGTVSGQVVEEDGKPVAGALAFVKGEATFLSAAVTDAEGRFRIPNVVKEETLELTICREGEARDSGEPLWQSNDKWIRRGVKASETALKIVLRKNQIGQRLPADTP